MKGLLALSELLRFRVSDSRRGTTILADLVIGQLDMEYPLVTHLIHRAQKHVEIVIPWSLVKWIDRDQRVITINAGDATKTHDIPGQAVRLRRDVLDALILELQDRRVTRANDLWLQEEEDGVLRLSAADTSAQAIIRRLTRGWYQGLNRVPTHDWKYIEFLRGDPQAVKAGAGYHRRIVHLPPGEIASLAAAIPYLHAAELLELLPEQLAADTLEVMSPERQLQVFEELDENRALQLLTYMAPDLATDLMGRIDTTLAVNYLNKLPRQSSECIVKLLRYPENSVGGIMANDMVTVSPNLKMGEARQALREKLKEPDFVYFVYVVDDESPHRLRGVLSLRQLIVSDDDQTVHEIMNPYLIALSPTDSPAEAAYRLLNSQLAALPVVGSDGQLLGAVTIDAAVSQVAPRSWRAQAPRVFS